MEPIFEKEEEDFVVGSPSLYHHKHTVLPTIIDKNKNLFTGKTFFQKIEKQECNAFLCNFFFHIFAYYLYCKIHPFMRKYFFEITENERKICMACFFGYVIGSVIYLLITLFIFSLLSLCQTSNILVCFIVFFFAIIPIIYRINVLSFEPDVYK